MRVKKIAGPVLVMLEGVIYAMPGQTTIIHVDGDIEYSEDGITFSPVVLFNNEATFSAPYVRSPSGTILASFK